MEPIFLTLTDIIQIHQDQIKLYGGSLGIRDMGLLQSAMAMPQAGFGQDYLHEDIFAMAGAYLFHIARNHPFVDGNKRAATVAALAFLEFNGLEFDGDQDQLEAMVRNVAEGKADKHAVAEFFRRAPYKKI